MTLALVSMIFFLSYAMDILTASYLDTMKLENSPTDLCHNISDIRKTEVEEASRKTGGRALCYIQSHVRWMG